MRRQRLGHCLALLLLAGGLALADDDDKRAGRWPPTTPTDVDASRAKLDGTLGKDLRVRAEVAVVAVCAALQDEADSWMQFNRECPLSAPEHAGGGIYTTTGSRDCSDDRVRAAGAAIKQAQQKARTIGKQLTDVSEQVRGATPDKFPALDEFVRVASGCYCPDEKTARPGPCWATRPIPTIKLSKRAPATFTTWTWENDFTLKGEFKLTTTMKEPPRISVDVFDQAGTKIASDSNAYDPAGNVFQEGVIRVIISRALVDHVEVTFWTKADADIDELCTVSWKLDTISKIKSKDEQLLKMETDLKKRRDELRKRNRSFDPKKCAKQ